MIDVQLERKRARPNKGNTPAIQNEVTDDNNHGKRESRFNNKKKRGASKNIWLIVKNQKGTWWKMKPQDHTQHTDLRITAP